MEWLLVIILGFLLLIRKSPNRGMSNKDIGKIADQMWKEWLGD